MDDLYRLSNREKFYKLSHHVKVTLRKLQTTDNIEEICEIECRLHSLIDVIMQVKSDDLKEYIDHMAELLDICERGSK